MIELPRSTYYYRSKRRRIGLSDERLIELIGDIQDEFPGYGYRRVTRALHQHGYRVNHKRIARIMRENGLNVKPRRRFVNTTDSDHNLPVFPNLYRNMIPLRHAEQSAQKNTWMENSSRGTAGSSTIDHRQQCCDDHLNPPWLPRSL